MDRRKFLLLSCLSVLLSCTESIDTSVRYVFKDETVYSYLSAHDDYAEYTNLLGEVPVSAQSSSTLKQLLAARGNYTVFAPTNDAIYEYLQTLVDKGKIQEPSWTAFGDSVLLDSVRKVIVYNSIIDGGDHECYHTYEFPTTDNGEFDRANLRDLKLSVLYTSNDADSIYINSNCPINSKNRDIRTINGVIHQIEKVIAPEEKTMADMLTKYLLGEEDGFHVMAKLCKACGLFDTLSKTRDETYENLYQRGFIEPKTPAGGLETMDGGYSYAPRHRKYGFTIFAEQDEFWEMELNKDVKDISVDDVQEWVKAKGFYPDAIADANYTSPQNLLYQWTTYHVLPYKLAPNRLTFHYCELGYDYNTNPDK